MWKKIAVTAACGAAVVGVGTAALAASPISGSLDSVVAAAPTTGSPGSTSSTGSTGSTPGTVGAGRKKGHLRQRFAGVAHATWVSKDKAGTYVTHSTIHGAVTAVSATSITVKAGDGFSQTYTVDSATKVRIRANGTGSAGKITDVKTGQNAVVTGTGTSTLSAELVVAGLPK